MIRKLVRIGDDGVDGSRKGDRSKKRMRKILQSVQRAQEREDWMQRFFYYSRPPISSRYSLDRDQAVDVLHSLYGEGPTLPDLVERIKMMREEEEREEFWKSQSYDGPWEQPEDERYWEGEDEDDDVDEGEAIYERMPDDFLDPEEPEAYGETADQPSADTSPYSRSEEVAEVADELDQASPDTVDTPYVLSDQFAQEEASQKSDEAKELQDLLASLREEEEEAGSMVEEYDIVDYDENDREHVEDIKFSRFLYKGVGQSEFDGGRITIPQQHKLGSGGDYIADEGDYYFRGGPKLRDFGRR